MMEFFASAAVLGLAGGFGPGPLMTLVISESLAHGLGAGIRVAIAPVLTDAPIIAISLLLISRLESSGWLLGAISIVGGLVVMRIGVYDLRRGAGDINVETTPAQSIRKGIIVNALNPHPYVFWLSVGAPLMVRAAAIRMEVAVGFIVLFYALLVGSKIVIAWIASTSRALLRGRSFDITIRALGGLMILFSLLLIRDGLSLIAAAQ